MCAHGSRASAMLLRQMQSLCVQQQAPTGIPMRAACLEFFRHGGISQHKRLVWEFSGTHRNPHTSGSFEIFKAPTGIPMRAACSEIFWHRGLRQAGLRAERS